MDTTPVMLGPLSKVGGGEVGAAFEGVRERAKLVRR